MLLKGCRLNLIYCKALDLSRSWKHRDCRCQTGVMISIISLDTIRNVFMNQPNPLQSDLPDCKTFAVDLGLCVFICLLRLSCNLSAQWQMCRFLFLFWHNYTSLGLLSKTNCFWFALAVLGLLGEFSRPMSSCGCECCASFVRISEFIQTQCRGLSL